MVFNFFYCVASTGSATVWVTELVEVIFCSSGDFGSAQSPCYIYYYSRCLSLSKAHSHSSSLWFRLRSITVLYLLLLPVPEPVEGTFLFLFPVISTSSITVLYLLLLPVPEPVEGTFSLILPVISTPLNHRVIFTTTPGAWACRRHRKLMSELVEGTFLFLFPTDI